MEIYEAAFLCEEGFVGGLFDFEEGEFLEERSWQNVHFEGVDVLEIAEWAALEIYYCFEIACIYVICEP